MHQIFDIALDSDISLPELPEACKVDASIRVQLGTEELRLTLDPIWFHDWKDANDKICMSCGYLENGYLLKFPGFVEFVISGSGNTIYYLPETDIPEETIRHLILDQVVPRVLGQQGRLVLHASAVSLPGRKSVAFLGNSGWGKSTMASSYHENGAYLITDDCLLIDTRESVVQVIPNYYGLRLYADSARAIFGQQDKFSNVAHYSEKKRLILHDQDAATFSPGISLDAIFLLGDPKLSSQSSDIVIKSVKGTNELMAMVEQLFVLDATDKKLMAQQFRTMGKIVSTNLPIYCLDYPRDYSQLPVVHHAIENVLKG